MKTLEKERQMIAEMEDEIRADIESGADQPLEPSEPPISDEAVGADTEGAAVVDLLSEIRDLLAQMVEGPEFGDEEEEAEIEDEIETPEEEALEVGSVPDEELEIEAAKE